MNNVKWAMVGLVLTLYVALAELKERRTSASLNCSVMAFAGTVESGLSLDIFMVSIGVTECRM